MRSTIVLCSLVVLLAGCGSPAGTPGTSVVPAVARTDGAVAVPTAAPTEAQATRAATAQPNATTRPTATATASVPPRPGTVPPHPLAISPGNAAEVQEVARWATGENRTVAWSPDGQWLAGGTRSGVYLYDAQTMEQGRYIETRARVFGARFSPDSTRLAAGMEDGSVQLWQVNTGEQLWSLEHDLPVYSVALSPDGQFLAIGLCTEWHVEWDCIRSQAQLLEAGTGRLVRALQPDIVEGVRSLAFSYDGRFLATKGGLVWEVATGRQMQDLGRDGRAVAFSPDGQYLASGSDDETVRLWDIRTGKSLRILRSGDRVRSVAFSSDGALLAGGTWSGPIRLWEVATGAEVQVLQGHSWTVESLDFSPDGRFLLSGSHDGTVRLWGIAGP